MSLIFNYVKLSVKSLRSIIKNVTTSKMNESPLIMQMSLAQGIVRRLNALKRGVESGEFTEEELYEVVEDFENIISSSGETLSTPIDFLSSVEASRELSQALSHLNLETLRALEDSSSSIDVWFQ